MNKPQKLFVFIALIIGIGISPVTAQAQAQTQTESSFMDELKDLFKNESLSVGALIQFRGDYDFSNNNSRSFSVPNARLKVSGKLDGGFNYTLQFDVADDPVFLDANLGYSPSETFNVTVGAQKPGISGEFLTGPQNIDFVSRSQVVTALTQQRDIGVRMHGRFDQGFGYSLGMFNGTGLSNFNDNGKFYYAGRLMFATQFEDGTNFEIGGNGSYGEQNGRQIASGILPAINGDYLIYGGDLRFENQDFFFATEVLSAYAEYNNTGDFDDTIFGYHITSGFKITDQTEILARWDSFETDDLPALDEQKVLAGFNYMPTDQTKLRFNYIIPVENSGFENHGVVFNVQIGF